MHVSLALRFLAVSILMIAVAVDSRAAVVVLCNYTPEPIAITVKQEEGEPTPLKFAPFETKAIPCGKHIEVAFTAGTETKTLKLEPYAAYMFMDKKKVTTLLAIELAGARVGDADIPATAPAATAKKVSVRLMVDDADKRTKLVWEPILKKRFEAAAEVMKAHTGVTFELASTDEWESDAQAAGLGGLLDDFEKSTPRDLATLTIGYTSRTQAGAAGGKAPLADVYAVSRGALASHILLRENEPRSEPERVEVLLQQLGRYLGAVPTPDPVSAMRTHLNDGKALSAKFHYGFDPLNTLAMNLWAEGIIDGKAKPLAEMPLGQQMRLARVYGSLQAAMPEQPLPPAYALLLEKANIKTAVAVNPGGLPNLDPAPRADLPKVIEAKLSAKDEAIRKVVKAIVVRAEDNARKPAADGRLRGDELTNLYVRTAADVASGLDKEWQAKAFLLGLGIALDDSTILRKNPFASELCKAVESDDERKQRLAVLGNPTMRFRRDLCQHFVVSCFLTGHVGATLAEQAGLTKEFLDMEGTSGFSFSDLCADIAGIEFSNQVIAKPVVLETLKKSFAVASFVPKIEDLKDGISKAKFKADYGDTGDARFKAAVEDVKKRVAEVGK